MTALSDFFAMGGHAGFIWTAYGVVAVVLVGLAIASRRELRARQQEIAALEAASPRRRAGGGGAAP
jgi:heme exporter protein D